MKGEFVYVQGSAGGAPVILNFGTGWKCVLKFTPHPGTHGIGGTVGPKAGLDAMEREKSLAPAGFRSPVRSARSLVTILTELPGFPLFLERLWKV